MGVDNGPGQSMYGDYNEAGSVSAHSASASYLSGVYGEKQRAMKMSHQYLVVTQLHTLASCPARWSFPLYLLLTQNGKSLDQLVVQPGVSILNISDENYVEIL